jgi:hypothetical protein
MAATNQDHRFGCRAWRGYGEQTRAAKTAIGLGELVTTFINLNNCSLSN